MVNKKSGNKVTVAPVIKAKNVIVNTAGTKVDARDLQAGDNKAVNLPIERGLFEQIGFILGQFLMNKIGLRTIKDLLLKTLLPAISFSLICYYSYLSNLGNYLTLGALLGAIVFFSIFITAFASRCEKCGKFFGIEIVSRKHLREKEFQDYVVHNIRETKRCQYCGHTETEEITETEEYK